MDILIIGGSAAGISAAGQIVSGESDNNVTVVYSENRPPYYRPLLSEYLSDKGVLEKRNFYLKSNEWYEKNINLIPGTKVQSIDIPDSAVLTDKGGKLGFDKLIIATGSVPFVPIRGAVDNRNAFTLRTLSDAEDIRKYSENAENAVVVGGGLLGLEIAFSLMKRGLKTTVIELAGRLLPKQLDAGTSAFLEERIKDSGVSVYTGVSVTDVISNSRIITSLELDTGISVPADLVVFSIGTKPEKDIAVGLLETDRGIIVNERMETSVPGIYACGDAAQYDYTPGLWMPAQKQGRVAGDNAAGGNLVFKKEAYPAVLNSFGTKIFSIGHIPEDGREHSGIKIGDFSDGNYMKLFFSSGKITGGVLAGNIGKSRLLKKCVGDGLDAEKALEILK